MGLRDQIINAVDCHREAVTIPEWDNATVYVRSITAADIDAWMCETYVRNGVNVDVNRENIRCRLLIRCLTDENNQRIFADNEADLLGAKNTHIIERLYLIAQRLNAVSKGDVEELAKN